MKLTITIQMDNAAFGDTDSDQWAGEASRILRTASDRLDSGDTDGFPLRDHNGNKVGELSVMD